MDYRQSIAWLYALAPRGIELGLGRMQRALALRDHPERACPAILVAGTNGKGSVATTIATVLRGHGHKVGLFTSPHLHRLVERFRIDGKPVSERKLARGVTALRVFVESESAPPLTFFELNTLLAFELFRDARCDVIVLEVGLGGRLDATNVVTPLVSVITSIALDHTALLGDTLAQVAREKAGIIKRGVPVVTGERGVEASRVIAARAKRLGAPLLRLARDFGTQPGTRGQDVWLPGRWLTDLTVPLAGSYQADNLACALAALFTLQGKLAVDERIVKRSLKRVRWPGRLELLPGAPDVLCDAAHNPHAAGALAQYLLAHTTSYTKRVLLFGAMHDKEYEAMLALLAPHVDALVFATAHTPRAESAHELARRFRARARKGPQRTSVEAFDKVRPALAHARKLAGKRGLVIACGSIFLMAEVRALTLKLASDPLIAL